MSSDKRTSERHRVRFHLVYDDGSSFNAGTVHDVSEGGLFLETALPLPVGTTVTLTPLDAAGQVVAEVKAKVMRSIPYDPDRLDQPAGMGLAFMDLTPEGQQAVMMMVQELEKQAKDIRDDSQVDPFLGIRVKPTRPPPR
ncbi:MAG: PilZ domain-containing protein [Myxococcota bacterium]